MNFLLGSMWTSIKCEFKLPIKKKKKNRKKVSPRYEKEELPSMNEVISIIRAKES